METTNPEQVDAAEANPHALIAPWWHTLLVISLIVGTSVLGSLQSRKHGFGRHHAANYLLTIAWEWVLAAIVYWGIRLRRVPLRQLLGERRHGWKALGIDVAAALIFWTMSTVILAALAVPFRLAHMQEAQKVIAQLAPQNLYEFLIWVALSVTAGFCEELIFRGYLQQQFARIGRRAWIGVAASAVCFGSAHGYEHFSGVVLITAYGAMFSVLVIKMRSLRPAMMAHAWHDLFTGAMLALAKHLRLL
jgi:membrane protease YdiL (CAAX protease family)